MTDHSSQALLGFQQTFGGEPDGIWRAPGRVNLIGEHTDYNDGFVLPIAIDRYTYVAARRRDDGMLSASSHRFGQAPPKRLNELERKAEPLGWAAYVYGVVSEITEMAGRSNTFGGMELYVTSDVPAGAGLSSSAALECATGVAVTEIAGLEMGPIDIARAAQRAENNFAGVPCGIMDQMASMLGRQGFALLIDTRSLTVEQVPFSMAGHTLLVIQTAKAHELADSGYARARQECEQAASLLGVKALRDIDAAELDHRIASLGSLAKRVRHVVSENQRVLDTVEALADDDISRLGRIFLDSHASLRDDYEVSTPELDLAVESAVAAGARGARMTGGGFGGSAIALVPTGKVGSVTERVLVSFEQAAFAIPEVFHVRTADGAHRAA